MDLAPLAREFSERAGLVLFLARRADEIRLRMPVGHHAPRPHDGIHRPVEDIVIAQEARSMPSLLDGVRSHLLPAIDEAERIALLLDHAIRRWEGDTSPGRMS